MVGLQTEQERNESWFPSLSYKTRIYAVGVLFATGCLVSILASMLLWTGRVVPFAVFYSIGNLMAMFSTVFLIGPKSQCSRMWQKERAGATAVYFIAMIATLVIAFAVSNPAPACLVLIIVQFLAGAWYSLSYIPFARSAVLSCLGVKSGGAGSVAGGMGV